MQLQNQTNKIWSFFVKNGWLTKNGDRVLTAGCLLFIGIPLWLIYEDKVNTIAGLFFLFVGIFLGAIVGYEGKAKQFGFEAPFTNDPLGWRKAKETYQNDASPDKPAKKDDAA
jgi:hypothetical protein